MTNPDDTLGAIAQALVRCEKQLDRMAGTDAYRNDTYETIELARDALLLAERTIRRPTGRR